MKLIKGKIPLKAKILTLIVSLLLFVIVFLSVIYSYNNIKDIKQHRKQTALQTAKMLSYTPSIKNALSISSLSYESDGMIEKTKTQVSADYVKVNDKQGYNLAHSKPENEHQFKKENFKAITFGGYYNLETDDVLWGKAPVYHKKKVVGVVSVGYLMKDIHAEIIKDITWIITVSLIVLGFGIAGGVFLTNSIRKDTLNLEPYEIAALYRERDAVLLSIKEGIISTNTAGYITMINRSAQIMLGVTSDVVVRPLTSFLHQLHIKAILENGEMEMDKDIEAVDKHLIVNSVFIWENQQIKGIVSSFRDKTELKNLVDTLSEVQKYSEDLRAQTHEFRNKLYVLSGLLQLERYQEAIDMIQSETTILDTQNKVLFNQILDTKVQAIILGKIGRASEKKVDLFVERHSSLQHMPKHIHLNSLIIIIGNLLDNAIDAVSNDKNGVISFFITDVGNDILFEIADNGPGLSTEIQQNLFKKGYSTKERNHQKKGYGLWNVWEVTYKLGGSIEITHQKGGGAVF